MEKTLVEMNLQERKIDLTLRLYVDTADEDYLAARMAYHNGLFNHFAWSAAQTCEKLLKASLLLLDKTTKEYGHDLVRLLKRTREEDLNGILPSVIDLPETSAAGREAWHGKPVELFVNYLARYGSADNRYGFEGAFINGPVLHCLDFLCRAIRRLMRLTNLTGGDLFAQQSHGAMLHDRILNPLSWMISQHTLLERLYVMRYDGGQDIRLRRAFANMNFAFFDERDPMEEGFGGQVFLGSPLHNHLVRLADLDHTAGNREAVQQLRAWADTNIQMSHSVRRRLKYPK